jgi:hypothetical protein
MNSTPVSHIRYLPTGEVARIVAQQPEQAASLKTTQAHRPYPAQTIVNCTLLSMMPALMA